MDPVALSYLVSPPAAGIAAAQSPVALVSPPVGQEDRETPKKDSGVATAEESQKDTPSERQTEEEEREDPGNENGKLFVSLKMPLATIIALTLAPTVLPQI